MFPNIKVLHIPSIKTERPLFEIFRKLEKVTWKQRRSNTGRPIEPIGYDLGLAPSLQELHLQGFLSQEYSPTARMSYHDNGDDLWLLCKYTANIMRLGIMNVQIWQANRAHYYIPQHALMKLVRRTPTLVWFRGNLTAENIAILQRERPDLCFASAKDVDVATTTFDKLCDKHLERLRRKKSCLKVAY